MMVTRDNNDAETPIGSVACRISIRDASSWDARDASRATYRSFRFLNSRFENG